MSDVCVSDEMPTGFDGCVAWFGSFCVTVCSSVSEPAIVSFFDAFCSLCGGTKQNSPVQTYQFEHLPISAAWDSVNLHSDMMKAHMSPLSNFS